MELLGNLGELVAQVRRRAEQRALALEASAEVQARRILDEGAERTREVAEARAAEARAAAEETRRQRLAVADLARRRRRLEAREARLERVWAEAWRELERIAGEPEGLEALAALARDAARHLGADEVTLRLDAGALARLGPEQVARWAEPDGPALRLDPEPLEQGLGLIARSERASIDATYAGRLAQARERLRGEVDALLTGPRAVAEP